VIRGGIIAIGAFVSALPAGAAAPVIQPGLWEIRSVVTAVDMPSAPPGVLDAMRGKPSVTRHCVSPEQAAIGPRQLFAQTDGKCSFKRFTMANGRIDTEMQCAGRGGAGTMAAVTTGNFTPIGFRTTTKMVMKGAHGMMTVSATGTGQRIGLCK
jgi:hypothetical protein